MSDWSALIVVGIFVILLVIGSEIAIAIGLASVIGFLFVINQPLDQILWTSFYKLNSSVLTAIPLFVFMGTMFANTGVVRSLFNGAEKWLGGLPGGLCVAVTGANAIFGAISGSAIAACATFGTIAFPEMEKKGYNPTLALGSILIAGTLAVLIPPSVLMVIYGALQSVSVVRLFAGGIVPGLVLVTFIILVLMIMVKIKPGMAPPAGHYTWKERLIGLREIAPWVLILGVILGVIFGGIMTPTEGAAMGAFMGIVTAIAYRRLNWKALKESCLTTVKVTSMVLILIATANLLSFVFQSSGFAQSFQTLFANFNLGSWGTMIFLIVLYFILGMFLDDLSMLIITLPFVMPLVAAAGFSKLWFGIFYVVMAEVAMVTPPFGLCIFALKGVVPQYDTMKIALAGAPFYPAFILLLVFLIAFPNLVLWLPGILRGGG